MAYAEIDDIRCEGFPEKRFPDARVAAKLAVAEEMIEKWTGRFFEPRDLTIRETWSGRELLILWMPIIRIDEIRFINTDNTLQEPMSATEYQVFNRHMSEGLLDKDDRESAKISFLFARSGTIVPHHVIPSPHLAHTIDRRTLNMRITGKFGYTDPDFTAGRTIASDGADALTAPNAIHMENAAFTDEDKGREITVLGSASNDSIRVIDTVVGPKDITTVEQNVVTEGAGFTADISAFPQFGATPVMIKEATVKLAARLLDPIATADPIQAAIRAGRLRRMTVRDQSVGLDADPRLTSQAGASMSGDPEIDNLIIPYIRPPRMASA